MPSIVILNITPLVVTVSQSKLYVQNKDCKFQSLKEEENAANGLQLVSGTVTACGAEVRKSYWIFNRSKIWFITKILIGRQSIAIYYHIDIFAHPYLAKLITKCGWDGNRGVKGGSLTTVKNSITVSRNTVVKKWGHCIWFRPNMSSVLVSTIMQFICTKNIIPEGLRLCFLMGMPFGFMS